MKRALVWYIAMAFAGGNAMAGGQDAPQLGEQRQDTLIDNLRLARMTVSMDKTTSYFPGEAATVLVTISNPTTAPLEVINPRAPEMASFAYSRQGGHGTKDNSEWSRFDPPKPPLSFSDPTIVIQPGQSVSMTFPPEPCVRPSPTFRTVPNFPGSYRLRFRLGGEVEFRVGAPVLEMATIVPLQQFKTYESRGVKQPKTVQEGAEVVAVELDGEHLLFIGTQNVGVAHKLPDPATAGVRWTYGLEPWVRVATVSSKVTKLSGAADPSGLVTILYATEDGTGGTVYLDDSRRPLGAHAGAH